MHRMVVGFTSVTLLICVIGVAGGQTKNDGKEPPHPVFKVLNGSHADPRITLAELLDSYENAIGGKEAVQKIQTVIAHGERRAGMESNRDRQFESSVEYFKSPNKTRIVLTMPDGRTHVTGYDGQIGWYDSPSEGSQRMSSRESALAAQELNLFALLHLRAASPFMTLVGSSKVKGRDVYVVGASLNSPRLHRSLFFDAETKLLIDSIVAQVGAGQTLITEQFYSNFRIVDGVKFPFDVQTTEFVHHNSSKIKRTRIECNFPLRDDFFSLHAKVSGESSLVDR